MARVNEIEPAPMSFAVYRCNACGNETREPHPMPQSELVAAIERDEVRAGRFHPDCPRGLGVEWIVGTGKTIFAVLASAPAGAP